MTPEQRAVVQWVAIVLACLAAVVLTVMVLLIVWRVVVPVAPEAPFCDPGTYQTHTSDGGPQCIPYPQGVRL